MATLYMGNKNYSSWSIRPWFFLRHAKVVIGGAPVREVVIPLDAPDTQARIAAVSKTGRVPALELAEGEIVSDSLSIGETLHELCPGAGVWPEDARARRRARSACAEMHSSFSEMRRVLVCNKRARYAPGEWKKVAADEGVIRAVEADIARVEELFASLLANSGGPFLCGQFGYVDSFFVPVVSRLATYAITPRNDAAAAYRARVEALDTYGLWEKEALAEPWSVEKSEYSIRRLG